MTSEMVMWILAFIPVIVLLYARNTITILPAGIATVLALLVPVVMDLFGCIIIIGLIITCIVYTANMIESMI